MATYNVLHNVCLFTNKLRPPLYRHVTVRHCRPPLLSHIPFAGTSILTGNYKLEICKVLPLRSYRFGFQIMVEYLRIRISKEESAILDKPPLQEFEVMSMLIVLLEQVRRYSLSL